MWKKFSLSFTILVIFIGIVFISTDHINALAYSSKIKDKYEDNNVIKKAKFINTGQISANIYPAKDIDYYKVFVRGGNKFSFSITPPTGADLAIGIFRDSKLLKTINNKGKGKSEADVITLDEDGYIYLKVTEVNNKAFKANYSLKTNSCMDKDLFEPNNDKNEVVNKLFPNISLNPKIMGNIHPAGDLDYYLMDIKESGQLTLKIIFPDNIKPAIEIKNTNEDNLTFSRYDFGKSLSENIILKNPGIYLILVKSVNPQLSSTSNYRLEAAFNGFTVSLRKFPTTFRNMLTILSDTDSTQLKEFEGIHKFINTLGDCGNLRQGVGLELGDTFFMEYRSLQKDNGRDYSNNNVYWWGDTHRDITGKQIRKYIKAGWIDTPHTFGDDFSKVGSGWSRNKTIDVLKEWSSIGFKPIAWVDHSNTGFDVCFFKECYLAQDVNHGTNTIMVDKPLTVNQIITFDGSFEQKIVSGVTGIRPYVVTLDTPLENSYSANTMIHSAWSGNDQSTLGYRAGSIPTTEFYHIDKTTEYGIKAFWAPMPNSVWTKNNLGRSGFNTCLTPQKLLNNVKVWGLMRYYEDGQTNNTYLGDCINRVLKGDQLGGPIEPDTYQIISTHWGYGDSDGQPYNKQSKVYDNIYELNGGRWFNEQTIQALRDLKKTQDEGKILITTTQRLVKYNLANDMLSKFAYTKDGFTVENKNGIEKITIHKINDEIFGSYIPSIEDLRGMTFYCDNPEKAQIWIGNTRISADELIITPADYTGKASIGIKWFQPDYHDYTDLG